VNQRPGKRKQVMQQHQKPDPPAQKEDRTTSPSAGTAYSSREIHSPEATRQRGEPQYKNKSPFVTAAAFVAAIAGFLAALAGGYQALISRDTERITTRAYITSTSFQLITYGDKSGGHLRWSLSPIIENSGNTSTRSFKIKDAVSGGLGRAWDFYSSISKVVFMDSVIGPRSQILGSKFDFSLELPRVFLPLVSYGIIKYRDVFGDPHFTEYCYAFIFREPLDWDNYPAGQPIRIPGATIDQCAKHNCEDDECGPDWKTRAEE
jgi:hypothetical protein